MTNYCDNFLRPKPIPSLRPKALPWLNKLGTCTLKPWARKSHYTVFQHQPLVKNTKCRGAGLAQLVEHMPLDLAIVGCGTYLRGKKKKVGV